MAGAESIILVPGLFGFAKIGEVDYFAAVAELLSGACQIAPDDITSLETPPTGALWRRVDALYRRVQSKIDAGVQKVHLVGHSTGGVDIRLLTNSGYLWPGGPSAAARTSFFQKIGAVVSVSAPHKGTPIARRLRGTLEDFIPVFYLISFLAKYEAKDVGAFKKVWQGLDEVEMYRAAVRALKSGATEAVSAPDVLAASQSTSLKDFLNEIIEDHPLIHELTPFAMQRLNEQLARANGATLPISNFVTVAPPPEFHVAELRIPSALSPFQRELYAASYASTRLDPGEFGPFPDGKWIGTPEGLATFAATAQDGVVPAASQTLDGHANSLIFGDHLDVVGHYVGAKHGGETVFDSGAKFDDARMEATWNAVGAVILAGRAPVVAAPPSPLVGRLDEILARTPVAHPEEVLDRITAIKGALDPEDGIASFNGLYEQVTAALLDAERKGTFAAPVSFETLAVDFANLYFAALRAWRRDGVMPRAWAPLFDASARRDIHPLQFAFAGMNAHINRDLPVALVQGFTRVGAPMASSGPEHDDYERVNAILEGVEEKAKAEYLGPLATRLDRRFDGVDDVIAGWGIREAREAARVNALALWELRRTPSLSADYLSTLDKAVGLAGRGLLVRTAI